MHSFKERDELLHSITDRLIQEYEDASTSDSVLSYPLRHMLIPHVESLLKVIIPACAVGEDIGKVYTINFDADWWVHHWLQS